MFNHPLFYSFFFLAAISTVSCAKKIVPDKPTLTRTDFKMDSLRDSEFNIPIQLNLKPIYKYAEKAVDTLYTSAGWPDSWVQDECGTRYKYSFRRGPLQVNASATTLSINFTGYYKIIGSTRVCVNGVALSPWTPACKCGFDEGERKVIVGFQNSVLITPDLKAKLLISRQEPQPIDKCNVCFWGQDITGEVIKGLKAQLDEAKANMEKSIGNYDLRPKFQALWDQLNKVYNIYGLGWLQINPVKIRLNNLFARNDSLNLLIGLTAKPLISFEKPDQHLTVVPNLVDYSYRPGFNIFLDAVLNYDSLSKVMSAQLRDRRFDLAGNKYIVVKDCAIYGADNENLVIRVNFEGSQQGLFYLVGKPVYDPATRIIELKDLDFDIKSKNMLVKTAQWIFSHKIINELKKYTRFDLSSYIGSAIAKVNQQLNTSWVKGVQSSGKLDDLRIVNIFPLHEHLIVRSNCSGTISVKIEAANFSL